MDQIRSFVLAPEKGLLLMNVLAELRHVDAQSVADELWILDVQLGEKDAEASSASRTRLYDLTKAYVQAAPGERLETICNTLEVETLGTCGLLDVDSFKKSLKKKNTFLKYRQTKFNLQKEESEGYAKLLTELLGVNSMDVVICNCLALVGYFRLDPNRVLDIILDAVGHAPDRLCEICRVMFVAPSSSIAKLEDLIGFKLSRIDRVLSNEARLSVIRSISVLLANNLCSVERIIPHLRLDLFARSCSLQDEQLTKSRKSNGETDSAMDASTAADTEKDAISASIITHLIAQTLESSNGWPVAWQLLQAIKGMERQCFRNLDASRSLQAFLSREISLVYSTSCVKSSILTREQRETAKNASQLHVETLEEFATIICPILIELGPESIGASVTHDSSLLHRIVRLLGCMRKANVAPAVLDQVLLSCVFPAMTLLPGANAIIPQELWQSVLSTMEPSKRFGFYVRWRKIIERQPIRPEFIAAKKFAFEQVNFALKRFCSDEERNLVPCRKFAKVSHVNPFCAFQNALRVSDNLIPFLVRSLDMCSELGRDVLGFLLCDYLVATRADKMKPDLTNDALWFSSFCLMVGEAFRRCPQMDLSPLIELVFDRALVKKDWLYLRVIEVLISSTSLMEIVTDYSRNLLASSSGGDTLRLLAFSSFSVAFGRRSRFAYYADGSRDSALGRLKQLLEGGRGSPLYVQFLIGMALARKEMLMDTKLDFSDQPEKSLRLRALLFDQVTAIFLQLGSLVSAEMSPQKLSQSIPPANDLLSKFKLDVAEAFHLARITSSPRKQAQVGRFPDGTIEQAFPSLSSSSEMIQLYARFWELSLFDLNFPKAQYDSERSSVESMKKELEKEDATPSVKKMLSKTRELLVGLKNEQNLHSTRFENARKILEEGKKDWAQTLESSSENLNRFLQDCLLPRILLSPEDAFFAAKFVISALFEPIPGRAAKELTSIELAMLSAILPHVVRVVLTCTGRETENLGVFLTETLFWIQEFEAEAEKSEPGAAVKLKDWITISQWRTQVLDLFMEWLGIPQSQSEVFITIQALSLFSTMKDAFPDMDSAAERLLGMLDSLAKMGGDEDEEIDDEFEAAQRAILRGKSVSLIRAIKMRKIAGKLRGEDGKFIPPAIPKEVEPAPAALVPARATSSSFTTTQQHTKAIPSIAPLLGGVSSNKDQVAAGGGGADGTSTARPRHEQLLKPAQLTEMMTLKTQVTTGGQKQDRPSAPTQKQPPPTVFQVASSSRSAPATQLSTGQVQTCKAQQSLSSQQLAEPAMALQQAGPPIKQPALSSATTTTTTGGAGNKRSRPSTPVEPVESQSGKSASQQSQGSQQQQQQQQTGSKRDGRRSNSGTGAALADKLDNRSGSQKGEEGSGRKQQDDRSSSIRKDDSNQKRDEPVPKVSRRETSGSQSAAEPRREEAPPKLLRPSNGSYNESDRGGGARREDERRLDDRRSPTNELQQQDDRSSSRRDDQYEDRHSRRNYQRDSGRGDNDADRGGRRDDRQSDDYRSSYRGGQNEGTARRSSSGQDSQQQQSAPPRPPSGTDDRYSGRRGGRDDPNWGRDSKRAGNDNQDQDRDRDYSSRHSSSAQPANSSSSRARSKDRGGGGGRQQTRSQGGGGNRTRSAKRSRTSSDHQPEPKRSRMGSGSGRQ